MRITITAEVPLERISNLLCSALEGGSNYWYTIEGYVAPPALTFRSHETVSFKHLDYPLNEDGALLIGDDEDPTHNPIRLDLEAIQSGLQLMAEKYPKHWVDFIQENDDAITGDVFLQLCLFGEVVYG